MLKKYFGRFPIDFWGTFVFCFFISIRTPDSDWSIAPVGTLCLRNADNFLDKTWK
jgi:hypothetical protein